jgi:hypothetical protein
MAVENLPPVHRFWAPSDLEGLTTKELMHLQLMLKSKMEVIADRYERELYRKDRYDTHGSFTDCNFYNTWNRIRAVSCKNKNRE